MQTRNSKRILGRCNRLISLSNSLVHYATGEVLGLLRGHPRTDQIFSLFELYLRRQITSYRSLQLLHIDLCRHLVDGRRRDVQKGPRNYVNVTSFSVTQDSFLCS